MRVGGGGGDPSGLTLGLAPIGPVDLCMQKKIFFLKVKKIKCPRPSASAEYIKPMSAYFAIYWNTQQVRGVRRKVAYGAIAPLFSNAPLFAKQPPPLTPRDVTILTQ